MISKGEALLIAKSHIPDLEERGWLFITDGLAGSLFSDLNSPAGNNCWIIHYSGNILKSNEALLKHSMEIIISKETGKVVYNNSFAE